jgi:hypothetical protein
VQGQAGVQLEGLACSGEPLVDVTNRDPGQPFGDPQRGMVGCLEQRTHLFDPLLQSLGDPVELRDAEHGAATGQAAGDALAEPDVHRAVGAQFRGVRVGPQVGQIEAGQLVAAQPVGIGGLEHHRVPQRPDRAFAAQRRDSIDPVVEMVEQLLHLVVGQRPALRTALVLVEMGDGVPLVTHLDRDLVEPVAALLGPLIARVGQVVAEHPQREVIATDRRQRQPLTARGQ